MLIGNALADTDVRREVNSKIAEVAFNGSVSLAFLLDQPSQKKNELLINRRIDSKNLLRLALNKLISENAHEYPEIRKRLDVNQSTMSMRSINDQIGDLLIAEDLQLFYPYSDEYANDDHTVQDFFVTYDPLVFTQTNEAFQFEDGISNPTKIDQMENDFIDYNPVYVIVPIDPCDIVGQPCLFEDAEPYFADVNGDYNSDGSDDALALSGLPDELENQAVLLKYNVNHQDIPQDDIVSTSIRKIRVRGTSWIGFGGTHQKLVFKRLTADGPIQNNQGILTAGPNDYDVGYRRITRKNCKNKKWVSFNEELDSDWNMSENYQTLAVFSKHHLTGEATVNVKAGAGLQLVNGQIVPGAVLSGSVDGKIKVGGAKTRAKEEISRRHVLATIVGNGTTGVSILDNGTNYNVKRIGIVDYYFKHYHIDLTD